MSHESAISLVSKIILEHNANDPRCKSRGWCECFGIDTIEAIHAELLADNRVSVSWSGNPCKHDKNPMECKECHEDNYGKGSYVEVKS